jgi:hypothetical protein
VAVLEPPGAHCEQPCPPDEEQEEINQRQAQFHIHLTLPVFGGAGAPMRQGRLPAAGWATAGGSPD